MNTTFRRAFLISVMECLESNLLKTPVLITLIYTLIKNASTKEAPLIRWWRGRDSLERRCLRRSHPCRALRLGASRPNSAVGRVCRTRGVVHTAYPCKIKKGPVWALFKFWRRRRDYSEQPLGCSDPSGFPATAARCQMLLESHLVEPRVLIPLVYALIKNASTKEALLIRWRRGRDSNPRYVAVYTLSRRAPSTTRPPLRGGGF